MILREGPSIALRSHATATALEAQALAQLPQFGSGFEAFRALDLSSRHYHLAEVWGDEEAFGELEAEAVEQEGLSPHETVGRRPSELLSIGKPRPI
jgi:hypothetical protein